MKIAVTMIQCPLCEVSIQPIAGIPLENPLQILVPIHAVENVLAALTAHIITRHVDDLLKADITGTETEQEAYDKFARIRARYGLATVDFDEVEAKRHAAEN